MRTLLALFFIVLSTLTMTAQQPPLIDREIFFDNPEITGAQLSPDAKWMTFVKTHRGVMNIWLKKADEPFEKAKPITADTIRPIRGYFWNDNSRYVLYSQDKGGNEDFHVYAVDPFAAAEAATGVPPARDLTPLDKTRAFIYNVSKKDPNKMWVGLNDRDPSWHDLYELNIASGERRLLRQNIDRISGWNFDWDENLRFASRNPEDGSTEFLRVDAERLTKIYSVGPLEEAYIYSFTPDNKQAYFVTNKDRNFTELTLLNPATGQETLVERDPVGKVDFSEAYFNDQTRELIYTAYVDAKERIYWKNKTWEAEYNFLKQRFPGKQINFNSMDKSQNMVLLSVYSDTDPGEVYLFDRKTKQLTFQYRPRPKLNPDYLSPMEPITYKSSDGLAIPAYLTIPKGTNGKKLPLMVIPHGGPWARDYWGYNSYAQYWSNRGYAVLQMNFRGSTGYGKAFLDGGNREWGDKMQDDITWGVKHLVAKGIADPKRVGILGGSYGGYATLAGVTFTPDLYKSAVAIVAPSNLNTLLASIPPYWEAGRKIFHLRMGDPTTPEGKAQLERQSPLNHVDKIKTPLMIVQGANDPRVKKPEADQIVAAMREKGIPIAYICADDEGHGFARPVNNMAYLAAAEKFMAQNLGGRYQTSMTPEVAKRLDQITVDPAKVVKPKRADEIAAEMAAAAATKPARDFYEGNYEYNIKIELSGQKIPMTSVRTVKSEGDAWVVNDEASSMMGALKDRQVIQKKTLRPLRRAVEQGPVKVNLEFATGEIKGQVEGMGQPQPVSIKIDDSDLAPDGPGIDLYLAAFDLSAGRQFFYKGLDAQSQKIVTYACTVGQAEQVTVPAGTYTAQPVVVKDTEGGNTATYWIAQGCAVKSVATLPAMGGATVTTELTKMKVDRP